MGKQVMPQADAANRTQWRWIAALVLLFAASQGCAKGVSESDLIASLREGGETAEKAARWLGGMESVKGLQAAIATGEPDLVDHYLRSFPSDYSPSPEFPFMTEKLSPALEKVVLDTLVDPKISPKMKDEVLDLARDRKFQTKALFDALLKEAQTGTDHRLKGSATYLLTKFDLKEIERPLLQLFESLDGNAKGHYAKFFAERGYKPALPALKAWVSARNPRQGIGYSAYGPIGRFGTPDAIAFLVSELDQYQGTNLDRNSQSSLVHLLLALKGVPPEVPLPMKAIIERTPHKTNPDVARAYIGLLNVRQNEIVLNELLDLVPDSKFQVPATQALQAYEPEHWTRIRAGLKRLLDEKRITEDVHRSADLYFKIHSENPERRQQQIESAKRRRAAEQPLRELEEQYSEKLRALEDRDPKKYKEAALIYQGMKDKLLVEAAKDPAKREFVAKRYIEIAKEREREAERTRFIERKPREAVRQMEVALSLRREYDTDASGLFEFDKLLWLADAYRFDLGDKQKALALYREVLDAANTQEVGEELGAFMVQGLKYWLPHEIRYLETGKAFTGTIGYDEAAATSKLFLLLNSLFFGIGDTDHRFYSVVWEQTGDDGSGRLHLERAAVSQLIVADAVTLLAAEANAKKIVEFFELRDPARYFSASILAIFDYGGKDRWTAESKNLFVNWIKESRGRLTDHSAVLADASKQFRKRNNIQFVPYSDTSMADPQRSWRLLLTAMREHDKDTVLSCFTAEAAPEAAEILAAVTAENWLQYSIQLVAITPARQDVSTQAFTVVRARSPKRGTREPDRSTQIVFSRQGKQWKVANVDFLRPIELLQKETNASKNKKTPQ